MPEIVPGFVTEQKVVTVSNNDSLINTEIATQAVGNWNAVFLTLFNSDASVIILFTRTIPAS